MAFTVEDGTGLPTANAYISEADADTYHADRGNAAWAAAASADKETAIVRATDFLDQEFTWQGVRRTDTQRLEWPREDVFDAEDAEVAFDAVPRQIEEATAEVALIALTEDLAPFGGGTGTFVGQVTVRAGPFTRSGTVGAAASGGALAIHKARRILESAGLLAADGLARS